MIKSHRYLIPYSYKLSTIGGRYERATAGTHSYGVHSN